MSDTVSRRLYEQIKWERDTAIQQLNDLGCSFGEKPRTDSHLISRLVRCKDCTHFHYDYWSNVNGVPLIVGHEICDFWGNGCKTRSDAFCSFAERREA